VLKDLLPIIAIINYGLLGKPKVECLGSVRRIVNDIKSRI
jgi:hypothetical protein